ncbi:AAA family ATPase [Patescibacteria group bacterium]|nr:AAA family ATPase [Patescibacteria group bacterium]
MLFLTGPHGSGKTTVANILVSCNFGYPIELGGTLRKAHIKIAPELSFGLWCEKGEKIYDKNFTDEILAKEINKQKEEILAQKSFFKDLIIVGSRSYSGIEYIINKVPIINNRKNIIIYIDVANDILRQRYNLREKKNLSPQEFELILENDRRIGIESIKPHADIIISNSESEEKLKSEVKKLITTILK